MIKVEVKDFQRTLKALGSVVSSKSALPVLRSVVLGYNAERSVFYMIASDSENWLQVDCVNGEGENQRAWAVMGDNDKKDPFSEVCLRFDKLSAAIDALPSALAISMWFETKGGQTQLRVDYNTGEFVLPCNQDGLPEDFPVVPQVVTPETANPGQNTEPVCAFNVPAEWLLPRMQSARAALVTGAQAELRPVMGCECLDVDHEGLNVVGTDGHQLFRDRYQVGMGVGFLQMFKKNENGEMLRSAKILLHKKAVNTAIKTFLPKGDISFVADTRLVRMAAQGMIITSVTLDAKYPNYQSVIPENPHQLVVAASQLQTVLQRIRLFTDDASELIRLQHSQGYLVISGEDTANACRAEERVEILNSDDTTLPNDFAIGVKQSTLREMTSCVDTDNIILKFSAPEKPITIYEESKDSQLLILVMPMLINPQNK